MKIFLFIRQSSFAKFIMADLFYAIRRLGWEVKWEDLDQFVEEHKQQSEIERRRAVSRLIEDINDFNPDLIFSYGMEYCANVFEELLPDFNIPFYAILNKPAVFFLFDFGYPFDKQELDGYKEKLFYELEKPDYMFFCWDKLALKKMKELGLSKTFYMPMAVNEEVFNISSSSDAGTGKYQNNLIFVGGPTDERIEHLAEIADLDLNIFGYGQQQWEANPRLNGCYRGEIKERERLRDCYQSTKISVNITRPHGPSSLNMRVFEAMACGSLMLTDNRNDASKLFREDEEIVVYESLKELKEKAKWLLKNENKRNKIAEAGSKRTLREHTYFERMTSHMPIVVQNFKELAVFNRIDKLAEIDPRRALALTSLRETKELIKYNMDNYFCLMAELNVLLGNLSAAVKNVALGLQENASHFEILKLKKALEEHYRLTCDDA